MLNEMKDNVTMYLDDTTIKEVVVTNKTKFILCMKIVDFCKVRIWQQVHGRGEGCTFWYFLKAAAAAPLTRYFQLESPIN